MTDLLEIWQDFSRTKVFAFRGITEAAYEFFAADYFRAILARSLVERITHGPGDFTIACIVYEEVPDSESVIVHWCWTAREWRNTGLQHQLWDKFIGDRHVFISHLTVLSEKLAAKYGWLFNPFVLYKGIENDNHKTQAHEPHADSGKSAADSHE